MSSPESSAPAPAQVIAAPPAEDPAVAHERKRQQFLAEQQRVSSIQDQLKTESELGAGGTFSQRSLLGYGLTPAAVRARARKSLWSF
jgi:hypothetical protein